MQVNNLEKYFSIDEFKKICETNDLYNKAKHIVDKLFEGKYDKENKPYIYHLLRVSERLTDPVEKVCGLLHDVIEDTDINVNDLLGVGFTKEIVDTVLIVTNEKADNIILTKEEKLKKYSQKIDAIINSGNIHAIRLKEADMSDNYDMNRIKELPIEKQEWFHKKYGTNINKLRDYINNHQ